MNSRQKKLTQLIATGGMTNEEAMLKAGYSESTSKQQSEVLGNLRKNSVMQEALRKAGFTEELIAEKVMEGLEATKANSVKGMSEDGDGIASVVQSEDHIARHKYLETGAKLLDAFPAAKNLHGIVDPEELLNSAEKEGETAPWAVPQEK